MDALFHFTFSLAGGFLLACGLNKRYSAPAIVFLSALSLAPDLEHVIGCGDILMLHNIFIPLAVLLLYFPLKRAGPYAHWADYAIILAVMLFGHLCMDMVQGLYGIPLLYPLSEKPYLIPEGWEVYLGGDRTKPIVSTYGIGAAMYFSAIGLAAISLRLLSSGCSGKRKNTRI